MQRQDSFLTHPIDETTPPPSALSWDAFMLVDESFHPSEPLDALFADMARRLLRVCSDNGKHPLHTLYTMDLMRALREARSHCERLSAP